MPMYRRQDGVEESPLQGDLMLFDPGRGQFFVLNRSMAHVWRCCDGETSLAQIVDSVPRSFSGTDSHPVQSEMAAALDQLVEHGLVAPVSVSQPASSVKEAVQ